MSNQTTKEALILELEQRIQMFHKLIASSEENVKAMGTLLEKMKEIKELKTNGEELYPLINSIENLDFELNKIFDELFK
jgi:hypothetical protein